MYKIIYQKENGIIFERIRNTIPGNIGDITSMGWTIKDILYSYKNSYYSYSDYCILKRRSHKRYMIKKNINNCIKRYTNVFAYFIFITLIILK